MKNLKTLLKKLVPQKNVCYDEKKGIFTKKEGVFMKKDIKTAADLLRKHGITKIPVDVEAICKAEGISLLFIRLCKY